MNIHLKELVLKCNFTGKDIEEMSPGFEKCLTLVVNECAKLVQKKSETIVARATMWALDEEELETAKSTAWQILVLGEEIKEHFGINDKK